MKKSPQRPAILADPKPQRKSPAEILKGAMDRGGLDAVAQSIGTPRQRAPRVCRIIRVNATTHAIYHVDVPITPEAIQTMTGMQAPRTAKVADGDDGFSVHVAGNDDPDAHGPGWTLEGCKSVLRGPGVLFAMKDGKVTSMPENADEEWVKERITWL